MPGMQAIRYEVPRGDGTGNDMVPVELRFEGDDISSLREVVEGTGLARMSFHRVFHTLEGCAEHALGEAATGVLGEAGHGGRITMAGFRTALRELIPKERLLAAGVDSLQVSLHLQAMHLLFSRGLADASRKGAQGLTADVDELACGFAVLCGGRKSTKLEGMFEIMDGDRDGRLNRRELWRMGRAMLLAFFACRRRVVETVLLAARAEPHSFAARAAVKRLLDACDDCAVAMALSIHNRSKEGEEAGAALTRVRNRAVSFDQFAAWYNYVGYSSHAFLELLSLRKWPGLGDLDDSGDHEAAMADEPEVDEDSLADDSEMEEAQYEGTRDNTLLRGVASAAPPGLHARPPPGPPGQYAPLSDDGGAPGLSGIAPPVLPPRGASESASESADAEEVDVDWLQFPLGGG